MRLIIVITVLLDTTTTSFRILCPQNIVNWLPLTEIKFNEKKII
jgi:hypothetical protein